MIRLALDTSSLACSAALRCGENDYERHEEIPREHTRLLMPMIRELLDEAGTDLRSLDAIVLGNGPGSFIGMRIAASVAQGLAHGAGLNIIPVSSLAAVAAEVFVVSDADAVAVAQDAHMSEIYLGLYRRGPGNLPLEIAPESLQGNGRIDDLRDVSDCMAAGQGWLRYPEYLATNANRVHGPPEVLYPRARYLIDLSESVDKIPPKDIEPAYLRNKVAEKPGA